MFYLIFNLKIPWFFSTGRTGLQGPTGSKGDQGITGAIGETGSRGLPGGAGPKGSAGQQGTPHTIGRDIAHNCGIVSQIRHVLFLYIQYNIALSIW